MRRISLLLAALAAAGAATAAAARTRPLPPHEDAVAGVLRVLRAVPVVAIDDWHGLAEEAAFYQRLLRDPRAPGRIRDVVIELGNERYQHVADRYVQGAHVPEDSVRMIFANTTQGPLLTPMLPMYRGILDAVRAVNARQPPGRRMRVLLGDPAVEWRTITRDALWELHKQRGDRMRELVRDSVLGKGRRGVVIGGGTHLEHRRRNGGRDEKWGALAARVYVVRLHVGFGGTAARLEAVMDSLPPGSLVPLRGTPLARLALDDIGRATPPAGAAPDTSPVPAAPQGMTRPDEGRTLADVADALLYLGPIRRFTAERLDLARLRRDTAYITELNRRACLMVGRGVDTTALFRAPESPRYFPDGVRPDQVRYDPSGPLPSALPPLPPELPAPCDRLVPRG
ncbi:MAG TPA: hypothetical protein VF541_00650 [Longimicrobium sp.]